MFLSSSGLAKILLKLAYQYFLGNVLITVNTARSLLVLSLLLAGSACLSETTEREENPQPSILETEPVAPAVTPTTLASRSTDLGMSTEALVYLEEALAIMQTNSINRDKIDWDALRNNAHRRAAGAQTTQDVYPAIEQAIQELQDGHSKFEVPEVVDGTELRSGIPTEPEVIAAIEGKLIQETLGYIYVPPTPISTFDSASSYATTMQEQIQTVDASSPCGWIVDLREHIGGTMDPGIVGLGAVLGEGKIGAFKSPDGSVEDWYLEGGELTTGNQKRYGQLIRGSVYQLQQPDPNVAVLISGRTASAGETIAVAFKGRPGTRFFGEPTAGFTTGVKPYFLSDGAVLALTESTYVDRTGKVYGMNLRPDEIIFDLTDFGVGEVDEDPVLQAAINWLLSQSDCQANE